MNTKSMMERLRAINREVAALVAEIRGDSTVSPPPAQARPQRQAPSGGHQVPQGGVRIPFGKYRDRSVQELYDGDEDERGYLEWMAQNVDFRQAALRLAVEAAAAAIKNETQGGNAGKVSAGPAPDPAPDDGPELDNLPF